MTFTAVVLNETPSVSGMLSSLYDGSITRKVSPADDDHRFHTSLVTPEGIPGAGINNGALLLFDVCNYRTRGGRRKYIRLKRAASDLQPAVLGWWGNTLRDLPGYVDPHTTVAYWGTDPRREPPSWETYLKTAYNGQEGKRIVTTVMLCFQGVTIVFETVDSRVAEVQSRTRFLASGFAMPTVLTASPVAIRIPDRPPKEKP